MLYKEITNLPFSDSFVFGLCGSWGEGKSSIINLLINRAEKNVDFLVVNYDPWYFKDEEAILSSFYNQIEYALSQRYIFSGIKMTFKKYQKLISLGLSQAGFKIDLLLSDESLKEIKQRIESYISRTGKKIIIFIDDVDRLQPEEALVIFKLVRLNAKFLNTIFLLSFDPVVVQNYLKNDLNVDPAFLEKIVQKPVPLPAIEQKDVDKFLDVHIDNLFKEMKIPQNTIEKFEKEFPYIYQTQIRKLFKTLRHAKRYLNGLRSTLPPIRAEVHLCDFFILEVIRVFYPRVYNDIWRNPWFYIPLKWSDTTYFLSPFSYSDENKKYSAIKKHIEGVVQSVKEAETLQELLKTIFFVEVKNALGSKTGHDNVADYRAEKRITHPESFRKYFMLKVSPSDISDEYVETTLDSWLSTDKANRGSVIEKTILGLQEKEMLLEFFKRLLVFINTIHGDVIHDVIRVIYRNASRFSKKGIEDLWNSEYDKAQSLLLRLLNDRIEKSNIHSILEEAVTNTPDLPFAVHLVLHCRKERGNSLFNIYDSIEIKELQSKVSQRLKEHFIDGRKDIFSELPERRDWGFVLHQWATNWMTFTDDNKEIVNNYIFSLTGDDAKKFTIFLMHLRESPIISGGGQMTFDLDKMSRAYNLGEIQRISDKSKNDGSLTDEEKESINLFLRLCNERYNSNKEEIGK